MPLVDNDDKVEASDSLPSSPPDSVRSSKKRMPLRAIAFSLIGIIMLAGAGLWWKHATSVEETDDSYVTGHVHQLSARIPGTVQSLNVVDNQHVDAGQLLLTIDPRDLQISLNVAKAAMAKAERQEVEAQSTTVMNARQAAAQEFQARSSISSAEALLNRSKSALDEARSGVMVAKSQIQQRQAELTRAVSDYTRYESLLQDRAVTTQIFERSKQDKQVAEANLDTAKESLKQAQLRVQEAQQSVLDAKSTVVRAQGATETAAAADAQTVTSRHTVTVQEAAKQQANAEYQNALTQLSYTRLIAPVAGRIGHRTVEVGQQIDRGQALMSIVSDEKWVVANFKETQLTKMRIGQEVDIHVDAFPDKHFRGKVDSFSPASGAQFTLLPPDNASGNFTKVVQRVPVKIAFDEATIKDTKGLLTPGMSVSCSVHVAQ